MRDGRASGTAFIVFASADGVAKAVELNEATFGACSFLCPAYMYIHKFCVCVSPPTHAQYDSTDPRYPTTHKHDNRRLRPLGPRAQVRAERQPAPEPAAAAPGPQ